MGFAFERISAGERFLCEVHKRGDVVFSTIVLDPLILFALPAAFLPRLSSDLAQQLYTALSKILVLENGYLLFLPDLVKIIHIKLPDKRRELLMLKILGQYLILKPILVLDDKGVALIGPVDDVGIDGVLKNSVGLDDEIGDFGLFLRGWGFLLVEVGWEVGEGLMGLGWLFLLLG